jgi:hypothetical protein
MLASGGGRSKNIFADLKKGSKVKLKKFFLGQITVKTWVKPFFRTNICKI